MKLAFYYLVCLLAVLLQITLLGGDYSINLVLAAIIATVAFLRASDVVPIALVCGLLLDLHSGTIFGFHIFFLLFAVLIAKFILHLGERSTGFWNFIFTLGILEVLLLFIQLVTIFSAEMYTQLSSYLVGAIWQVLVTLIAGALLYAGFIKMQDYLGSGRIKKHWLWGN
jgi:hypothetical protein